MTSPATEVSVAYFTMEAALEPSMPTYSGGLGILSGDTLRASADVAVPQVAVTLLYRQGFFEQHLDASGHQSESPQAWQPEDFLNPCDARVSIEIEGRSVVLTAWLYRVQGVTGHQVPVYLLDADLPENDPADRALTGQLYGGDRRYRLRQEAVLGLGGFAMLRALGYTGLRTFHMNEGHCSFLPLALLAEVSGNGEGIDASPEAIEEVRKHCVFTTHTPVPAGHDWFDMGTV